MKLVSVIIPTYKRPHMLARALKSIDEQTYNNIEVIVIDDNGIDSEYDDSTFEVITNFKNSFCNLIYIKNEINIGGGLSRNKGVESAKGIYITFLDDDDTYTNFKIASQVEIFLSSELNNLGCVYCQTSKFDYATGTFLQETTNYFRGAGEVFRENIKNCIAGTPTLMIRKDVFELVGGFRDVSSRQDWMLINDIFLAGYSFDFSNKSLVNVYIHREERISTSIARIKNLEREGVEIRDELIEKISDLQIKKDINFFHHYFLANSLKFTSKIKSFYYFINMLKYRFKIKYILNVLSGLFLGEKISLKLKNIIKHR